MADVAISGAIDPSAFPFLLIDLHRNGATGSLKVAGPSYQKALYFRAGRILFGSSNDPRDQLGAILIESGKITPEQLGDVNAKVGPGSPLAKVLTDTGFVNQRELSEAARAKVERILSDIVAYDSGTFEFEDGVLPKGAVDLKLSTERVVVAAVRRVTDRNFVLRYIDGMEVVLRGTNDVAVPFAEIETDTSGITHYLDGVRTLKEAASLARLDDFEAAKIACALLFLGAVEKVSIVDLGEVAAAAQGVSAATSPEPAIRLEPPASPPFMIPASEPAPSIGMEADDQPIIMAPTESEAPFVLTEPEPAALRVDEPITVAAPPYVEPPIAPPPPARRQYDMPAAAAPVVSEPTAVPTPAPVPAAPAAAGSAEAVASAVKAGSPARPVLTPAPPRAQPPVTAPGPEPRERPFAPAGSRPSQEDLAALDQILGPRSESASGLDKSVAAGAVRPATRVAARTPATSGSARRGAPSRMPLFAGAGAALALAAVAAWFFLMRPRPEASATPVQTSAPATQTPSSSLPATPPPFAPAATTAGSAPATQPAPPADDARALLQAGSYPEASRVFASDLKAAGAGAATIQLLIACSAETVQKAVQNVGAMELVIVPHRFEGKDCYRLCWGIYPSTQQATAAVRSLPAYFSAQRPRVVRAAEITP